MSNCGGGKTAAALGSFDSAAIGEVSTAEAGGFQLKLQRYWHQDQAIPHAIQDNVQVHLRLHRLQLEVSIAAASIVVASAGLAVAALSLHQLLLLLLLLDHCSWRWSSLDSRAARSSSTDPPFAGGQWLHHPSAIHCHHLRDHHVALHHTLSLAPPRDSLTQGHDWQSSERIAVDQFDWKALLSQTLPIHSRYSNHICQATDLMSQNLLPSQGSHTPPNRHWHFRTVKASHVWHQCHPAIPASINQSSEFSPHTHHKPKAWPKAKPKKTFKLDALYEFLMWAAILILTNPCSSFRTFSMVRDVCS